MHFKEKFFASLLLCVVIVSSFTFTKRIEKQPEKINKAAWMRHTKYGIMVHYLEQLQNEQQPWNQGKKTNWDSCVNDFNVNLFAKQMHDMGAGYVIFTTQQGSKYFCMPNTAFESISGYKRGEATAHRDLILDLSSALNRYGIKLILYVTGDGTSRDMKSSVALQNPVLKQKQNGNKFLVTETWVNNWSKVLNSISLQYGNKVAGWWVDGAYPFIGYNNALLGVLSKNLKAGNPNSIVAFNPSPKNEPVYYSKWDDYTAGEINDPKFLPPVNGKVKGIQWHQLSYLGSKWQKPDIRFKSDSLINYINHINANHGVITLEVCLLRNGSIAANQYNFMKSISSHINKR